MSDVLNRKRMPEGIERATREQCVRIDNLIGHLHTIHSKYKALGIYGVLEEDFADVKACLNSIYNHITKVEGKSALYESADFYHACGDYDEILQHMSERDALEEWGHVFLEETPISEEKLRNLICTIKAYNKKTIPFAELRAIAYRMVDSLEEDLTEDFGDGDTQVVADTEHAKHLIATALNGLTYNVSAAEVAAERVYKGESLVALVRKEFPEWLEEETKAETPKSNEVLPEKGYVVWFARGGDILRAGPFKTQLEATNSLRLRKNKPHAPEVPVFPPDAFVWCEQVPKEEKVDE